QVTDLFADSSYPEGYRILIAGSCKKITALYKYPGIIEFFDELPKIVSGKIKRVDIRKKGQDNE
ncbi:MAG: hypothetical protein KAS96_06980, partial [Planctomycetes bacterium]|nr:hypothetical protein [Planctomycetota bacterium]